MTLIGLLADLAAHDPIQFAERMLVNAKLAAARGDGRTAARHTATAMVAAQKALEAENQPRKAREIIGDARRLATLLKFQLATQTGLAPQRQPLAAAEIHFTEALRKLDELKLDEALERLKNAHTAAIQSQIDAELNQDPYTQRQAQVMAENIQTYATAIRSSVDNPLALITMLTAMKAQGMSGLSGDGYEAEYAEYKKASQIFDKGTRALEKGQMGLAAKLFIQSRMLATGKTDPLFKQIVELATENILEISKDPVQAQREALKSKKIADMTLALIRQGAPFSQAFKASRELAKSMLFGLSETIGMSGFGLSDDEDILKQAESAADGGWDLVGMAIRISSRRVADRAKELAQEAMKRVFELPDDFQRANAARIRTVLSKAGATIHSIDKPDHAWFGGLGSLFPGITGPVNNVR